MEKVKRSYEKWLAEVEGVAFTQVDEYKAPDKLKALQLFGKATGYYQEKAAPPLNPLETAPTEILLAMLAEVNARHRDRHEAETIEAHDTTKKSYPYFPDMP